MATDPGVQTAFLSAVSQRSVASTSAAPEVAIIRDSRTATLGFSTSGRGLAPSHTENGAR